MPESEFQESKTRAAEGGRHREIGFSGVVHRRFPLFGICAQRLGPVSPSSGQGMGGDKAQTDARWWPERIIHSFIGVLSGALYEKELAVQDIMQK